MAITTMSQPHLATTMTPHGLPTLHSSSPMPAPHTTHTRKAPHGCTRPHTCPWHTSQPCALPPGLTHAPCTRPPTVPVACPQLMYWRRQGHGKTCRCVILQAGFSIVHDSLADSLPVNFG